LWLCRLPEFSSATECGLSSFLRSVLRELGIDPNKEAETVADGPLQNGLYHYGGWFFFVGEMVAAGEGIANAGDSAYFKYWFSRFGPCPEAFRHGPRLCVEFDAQVKWILDESWDSGQRARPATPKAPEEPA
jgi:hypothetical protein